MTIKAFSDQFKKDLSHHYEEDEISVFYELLMEFSLGYKRIDLMLKSNEELTDNHYIFLNQAKEKLINYEPIQHIIGSVNFYGLKLNVNKNVLIPRPETEELVQWILHDTLTYKNDIIDICTGSGCIGLALKQNLKESNVTLLDVSQSALKTAKENAVFNKIDVSIIKSDILINELSARYDIIVCNPPYIRNLEKSQMAANVLNYEPHIALFVNDNDPLKFYRRIAMLGTKYLKNNGSIFVEINEYLGEQTLALFRDLGYTVELRNDINNKNRMIKASKIE